MADNLMENNSAETAVSDNSVSAPTRRLPVWVIVLAFVLLVAFMGLIGWGLNRSMRGAIAVGDPVPKFAMTTFDGQTMDTAQISGKVILVNFWASWCKPCEQEAADLRMAWDYYKPSGKVVFLGVDYVDTEPEARAYLEKFGIVYANGPDLGTKVSQLFRIQGVPETYFLDQQGVLRHVQVGPFTSVDDIKAVIDPMLK